MGVPSYLVSVARNSVSWYHKQESIRAFVGSLIQTGLSFVGLFHPFPHFFFKIGRERFQIPYGEILYFEAQGRRVRLKMEEKEFLFYMKIREISRQVDNTLFVQCHVSYLVNMEPVSYTHLHHQFREC